LAALTGKLGKTGELARAAPPYASTAFNLPVPVMDAAAPFFAFAALGVCGDTTEKLERHLDDQIARYVAEANQPRIIAAVKARPLSMLGNCSGGKTSLRVPAGSGRILTMQQALAKGDTASVKTMLAAFANDARTQRPGDISSDVGYQIAWLRVATGDSAGAASQLDRTLGGLPSMSGSSLRDPASAAASVRAMALRADLAAARGEREQQQQWAQAVVDLWTNADQPLQNVVAKMRSLTH
jgi:hypothetical protein